jgi:thymidine kinase
LASSGESLEEIQLMMPFATKIEICPAVCTTCGADAYYTTKIGGRPEQEVEVGGLELYQPRCFKHFDKFGG